MRNYLTYVQAKITSFIMLKLNVDGIVNLRDWYPRLVWILVQALKLHSLNFKDQTNTVYSQLRRVPALDSSEMRRDPAHNASVFGWRQKLLSRYLSRRLERAFT